MLINSLLFEEANGKQCRHFVLDDTKLGHTELVQHHVDTSDHPQIKQLMRRVPFVYRDNIVKMVASVEKQCYNLQEKDVYPLPRIDHILDTLEGMKFFTSLDLASRYWQIGMEDASRAKSAFITHRGLYEFKRLMECVLSGMIWKSCFAYLY